MLEGAGRARGVPGAELVQEEPARDGDEKGRLAGIGSGPGSEGAGELAEPVCLATVSSVTQPLGAAALRPWFLPSAWRGGSARRDVVVAAVAQLLRALRGAGTPGDT